MSSVAVPAEIPDVGTHTVTAPHRSAPRHSKATPTDAGRRPTSQMTGEETRSRIIAAAVGTLNDEGITGASARTIARRGAFNQALIFYHFGSVEGLLLAAALSEGEKRSAHYADRFGRVDSLAELVSVAREVHSKEMAEGGPTVLTQLLAGSISSPTLAKGILEAMKPWMTLVEQAVNNVIGGGPLADMVPIADVAFAIASLFLGMELLANLDPEAERSDALFDSIARVAGVMEMLLKAVPSKP